MSSRLSTAVLSGACRLQPLAFGLPLSSDMPLSSGLLLRSSMLPPRSLPLRAGTPTGASAARRHTRQAPDTSDRTAIDRATEPAHVTHMYVYSSPTTRGFSHGSCKAATVGPRTVGRPIACVRALPRPRQATDTSDRTAIHRTTAAAHVPHMYVYSSPTTRGSSHGSCKAATVGPRTVGRPIACVRALPRPATYVHTDAWAASCNHR